MQGGGREANQIRISDLLYLHVANTVCVHEHEQGVRGVRPLRRLGRRSHNCCSSHQDTRTRRAPPELAVHGTGRQRVGVG